MASPIELKLCSLLPAISSAQFRCHIFIYNFGVLQITMHHTWSVSATAGLNNEIFGSILSNLLSEYVKPKVSDTYLFVYFQETFFRKNFITMSRHNNSKHQ